MYVKEYDSFRKTLAFFMLSPCRALYFFLTAVLLSISAALLLAFFAPIDEVVRAKALLRPCGVVSSVKALSSGEVKCVLFTDGMAVKKGDMLFSLNTDSYKKELSSLKSEKEQLEQTLRSYQALSDTITTGNIDKVGYDKETLAASYSYLYENQKNMLDLEKKKFEFESEQRMPESMRVPYKIEQLRLLYETQRAETMSWRQAQFVSCLQSIKDVQRSILSAENRIAELEKAIGESVFYAQIDGSVIAVHKLNEGDNVFSGEEIARIVPEGEDKLKAELYVSSDDIAKIQNGNAVYLSFSSLPPEIYGFLKTDIAFIPSDCTASKGNEAVFSVLTDDFSATLSEKRGKRAHLLSGMDTNCRIITGRTTALHLFLKKLDFMH